MPAGLVINLQTTAAGVEVSWSFFLGDGLFSATLRTLVSGYHLRSEGPKELVIRDCRAPVVLYDLFT